MKRDQTRLLVLISILVASCSFLFASPADTGAPEATKGFRADYLTFFDSVTKKLVDLAQAMPAEKYSWRPGDGVRSVGEVYMHIASDNFMLPKYVGIEPPPGSSWDMDKSVPEKAKVVEALKNSIDHVRQAFMKTSDADMEKTFDYFGQKADGRAVFFEALTHMHEHLGQSIAYARMNGVVPPWSVKSK